jgi:fumarate reductase flavoprotein subunit
MEISTDIVVIGSGATGLAAALTAAESGAKVIVFEKQRSPGGTSNFFEGTFAVESTMQRERYIMYSTDEAFHAIMEYSHWRANPRLVRAIVNESGPTISWLQKEGVEFEDATINMPHVPRTYHIVKGHGAAVMKSLTTRAKELGVDLRTGAPVKNILREGGKIVGVIAEQNGEEIEVRAGAVVIGTGGYANHKEWIKKYTGFDLDVNLMPIGNVGKTGDGIRMAWEAGAAEEGMGVLELYAAGPLGPDFAMMNPLELAAAQPNLWVTVKGIRFCDESIGFYDTSMGNAAAKQKEGYHFRLFDDSIKERLLKEGIDKSVGVDNPPGTRPVALEQELTAAFERGTTDVFMGNSVEELAAKLGIEPAVLRATVDEYNGYCGSGHDELFAKDRRYLRPLTGPRFYAVKARTLFLGTMGGIRINERMEVIDKKGQVIPGLYAGGFDAGGMWGDSYPITTSSGLCSAFAMNSGRIAGKNAASYSRA